MMIQPISATIDTMADGKIYAGCDSLAALEAQTKLTSP